jgi:glyoxylase-like metal-dependent hydrolase (beta-lactamase superfamily II)
MQNAETKEFVTDTTVQRFAGPGDGRIYRIPVRAFPGFVAYAYVVVDGDYVALIDAGSGHPDSNADLEAGMAAIRAAHGDPIGWAALSRIVITHGHIDHCGGLGYVRARSAAPIAAHSLDLEAIRDLGAYLDARAETTAAFLRWAGVDEAGVAQMRNLYGPAVQGPPGRSVHTMLADGDLLDERFRVIHTPGHCAGMVCLRLGDVLFCADHILAATNPRLTPAHLEPHNGLAPYLAALDRVAAEPGLRLGLAGHEAPIVDLYGRIAAIRASHLSRLDQIRAACAIPRTVHELAALIYPTMQRPNQLFLALQAVAARVEYLETQGALRAEDGRMRAV